MKKFIRCLMLFIIALGMLGCHNSVVVSDEDDQDVQELKTYQVKETAKTDDDLEVTVTKVTYQNNLDGQKAKDGQVYAIVKVTILNDTDDRYTYSSDLWQLDGKPLRLLKSSAIKTLAIKKRIAAGSKLRGSLIFTVPDDESTILLAYYLTQTDQRPVFYFQLR